MTDRSPGLYLVTPVIEDPTPFLDRLSEALAVGTPEAVMVRMAPADERTLVNRLKVLVPPIQARGGAAILADPGGVDLAPIVSRAGADGGHVRGTGELRELRERLGSSRTLGVGGLRTRDDAMVAGEAGVDYLLFGEPRPDGSLPDLSATRDRAAWWAEIFQVSCAAFAHDLASVADLAATGAEFVAIGDAVWSAPSGPAAALRDVAAMLVSVPEAVS